MRRCLAAGLFLLSLCLFFSVMAKRRRWELKRMWNLERLLVL